MEIEIEDLDEDLFKKRSLSNIAEDEEEEEEPHKKPILWADRDSFGQSTATLSRSIDGFTNVLSKSKRSQDSMDITQGIRSQKAPMTKQTTEKLKWPVEADHGDLSDYKIQSIEDDEYKIGSIDDGITTLNLESPMSAALEEDTEGHSHPLRKWTAMDNLKSAAEKSKKEEPAALPLSDSVQTLKGLSNESIDVPAQTSHQIESAATTTKKTSWFKPLFRSFYRDETKVKFKKPTDKESALEETQSVPKLVRSLSTGGLVQKSHSFLKLLLPSAKIGPLTEDKPKAPPIKPSRDYFAEFAKRESERFSEEYEVKKQLGSGGHSSVQLAIRKSDGEQVVCKFINSSSVWHWHTDEKTMRRIPLEIQMMKLLNYENHPGIIRYLDHFEIGSKFIIVMEYLGEDWIDLYDYIELFGPVKESDAIDIFQSVVEIVYFLHNDMGLCHNDIKDENVMINVKTRQVKLIDFGSLTELQRGVHIKSFYGTKKFSSPEALGGLYSPELQEVWALGSLYYVLLFKMDPFKNDDEVLSLDIGKRIERILTYGINGKMLDISEASVQSIRLMLEKDWGRRPRVDQLPDLPIFSS